MGASCLMVTVADVRRIAQDLPRSYEVVVRDRIKFRVGKIVYLAFSRDETTMGFGYPKEERAALVESQPEKFFLPRPSDMRFHWVEAWMSALAVDELPELVIEAWRLCVPKRVYAEYLASRS